MSVVLGGLIRRNSRGANDRLHRPGRLINLMCDDNATLPCIFIRVVDVEIVFSVRKLRCVYSADESLVHA